MAPGPLQSGGAQAGGRVTSTEVAVQVPPLNAAVTVEVDASGVTIN